MIAKFNPTGTHIHKDFLKVRIDLYPEPENKTYAMHYVDKPERPYTEKELENETLQTLVPKHKELNPCLCHFIKVNPDISKLELRVKIKEYFDSKTLIALDNALSRFDTLRVQEIMKTKLGDGRQLLPSEIVEVDGKQYAVVSGDLKSLQLEVKV